MILLVLYPFSIPFFSHFPQNPNFPSIFPYFKLKIPRSTLTKVIKQNPSQSKLSEDEANKYKKKAYLKVMFKISICAELPLH